MLDRKTNQSSKFITKEWVEINDKLKTGGYDVANQIKFKTTLVKSSLHDYSDTYIFVKEIITNIGEG